MFRISCTHVFSPTPLACSSAHQMAPQTTRVQGMFPLGRKTNAKERVLETDADTHLVTQCAAVNTHWVPIRAPPHRYWFRELISATCQHHSAASASSPPTTRDVRVLDVPLTPHTYLLYVDGLDASGLDVVSVDTVGLAE